MTIESELIKLLEFSNKREKYMDSISNKIKLTESFFKKSNINFISIEVFDKNQLAWSPSIKRLILIDINNICKPLIEYPFPIRERIINENYLLNLLVYLNKIKEKILEIK